MRTQADLKHNYYVPVLSTEASAHRLLLRKVVYPFMFPTQCYLCSLVAHQVIIPVLLQKVQGRTGMFLPSYTKSIPSQALTSFSVPVCQLLRRPREEDCSSSRVQNHLSASRGHISAAQTKLRT